MSIHKLFDSTILFVLMLTSIGSATGNSQFRDGFRHYRDGRFTEAAVHWSSIGDTLSGLEEPSETTQLDAAFAYVLATVAWEKSFNARAYQTWGLAMKCYQQTGTSWDAQRVKYWGMPDLSSGQMNIESGGGGLIGSVDIALLLEIIQTLALQSYNGPGMGLVVHEQDSSDNNSSEPGLPQRGFQFDNTGLFADTGKTESESGETVSVRGIYPVEEESVLRDTTFAIIELPPPTEMQAVTDSTALTEDIVAISFGIADSLELLKYAAEAWKYFSANYHPETGMVDPVSGYHLATLWDLGSNLAGYVAADKLGLISHVDFINYLDKFLSTLSKLPLYANELPNREYDVSTGKSKWDNKSTSQKGSGWSALDIGRMLIWLKITANWYPEKSQEISRIVQKWRFERLVKHGELNGTWFDGKLEYFRQEGRWGYEQYSAAGIEAWGTKLPNAYDNKHLDSVQLYGVSVLYDKRNLAWLTSEPFILAGLELGDIDPALTSETRSLYEVQKIHAERTGTLTAVSEDAIDRKPYFVYNCVYYQGRSWVALSHNGVPEPKGGNLSTKACFGWEALFKDEYAISLQQKVSNLISREGGYYGGIYYDGSINKSKNINTNAIILESILYKIQGREPFLRNPPRQ